MIRLGSIVEGHGETLALPTLITRVARELHRRDDVVLPAAPVRINRSRFANAFNDFSRALRLLASQVDCVIVVIDSDDDDPIGLRDELEARARQLVGHVPLRVAPAVREYEAWLLASATEMAGQLDLPVGATYACNPEVVRNAKGAFRDLLGSRVYSETVDQKRYTAIMNLHAATRNSPSFSEFARLLGELLVG